MNRFGEKCPKVSKLVLYEPNFDGGFSDRHCALLASEKSICMTQSEEV